MLQDALRRGATSLPEEVVKRCEYYMECQEQMASYSPMSSFLRSEALPNCSTSRAICVAGPLTQVGFSFSRDVVVASAKTADFAYVSQLVVSGPGELLSTCATWCYKLPVVSVPAFLVLMLRRHAFQAVFWLEAEIETVAQQAYLNFLSFLCTAAEPPQASTLSHAAATVLQ